MCTKTELQSELADKVHLYSIEAGTGATECPNFKEKYFWSDETAGCGAGEHWMYSPNKENKCKSDTITNNQAVVCCADA